MTTKVRLHSKGKKTDAILQFISEAGDTGRRFTDVVKFAYEYSHGEGSYDPDKHRGYWGDAFGKPTLYTSRVGHLLFYITKNVVGRWIVRDTKLSKEEIRLRKF